MKFHILAGIYICGTRSKMRYGVDKCAIGKWETTFDEYMVRIRRGTAQSIRGKKMIANDVHTTDEKLFLGIGVPVKQTCLSIFRSNQNMERRKGGVMSGARNAKASRASDRSERLKKFASTR